MLILLQINGEFMKKLVSILILVVSANVVADTVSIPELKEDQLSSDAFICFALERTPSKRIRLTSDTGYDLDEARSNLNSTCDALGECSIDKVCGLKMNIEMLKEKAYDLKFSLKRAINAGNPKIRDTDLESF